MSISAYNSLGSKFTLHTSQANLRKQIESLSTATARVSLDRLFDFSTSFNEGILLKNRAIIQQDGQWYSLPIDLWKEDVAIRGGSEDYFTYFNRIIGGNYTHPDVADLAPKSFSSILQELNRINEPILEAGQNALRNYMYSTPRDFEIVLENLETMYTSLKQASKNEWLRNHETPRLRNHFDRLIKQELSRIQNQYQNLCAALPFVVYKSKFILSPLDWRSLFLPGIKQKAVEALSIPGASELLPPTIQQRLMGKIDPELNESEYENTTCEEELISGYIQSHACDVLDLVTLRRPSSTVSFESVKTLFEGVLPLEGGSKKWLMKVSAQIIKSADVILEHLGSSAHTTILNEQLDTLIHLSKVVREEMPNLSENEIKIVQEKLEYINELKALVLAQLHNPGSFITHTQLSLLNLEEGLSMNEKPLLKKMTTREYEGSFEALINELESIVRGEEGTPSSSIMKASEIFLDSILAKALFSREENDFINFHTAFITLRKYLPVSSEKQNLYHSIARKGAPKYKEKEFSFSESKKKKEYFLVKELKTTFDRSSEFLDFLNSLSYMPDIYQNLSSLEEKAFFSGLESLKDDFQALQRKFASLGLNWDNRDEIEKWSDILPEVMEEVDSLYQHYVPWMVNFLDARLEKNEALDTFVSDFELSHPNHYFKEGNKTLSDVPVRMNQKFGLVVNLLEDIIQGREDVDSETYNKIKTIIKKHKQAFLFLNSCL